MKNQKNKKPNQKKAPSGPSSLLIWASIIMFIVASFAFLPDESSNEVEISYNTYKELLADNKIKEASIENDNSFHGELFEASTLINKNGAYKFVLNKLSKSLVLIDSNFELKVIPALFINISILPKIL